MTLKIEQLTLQVNDRTLLKNGDLLINPGNIVTIMGESGCGKSTLLNAIAGYLPEDLTMTGQIFLDGKRIDLLPAYQRRIGYQWQDPCLFPHLNVWENLAFALPRHIKGKTRQSQAIDALDAVNLSVLSQHRVSALSGGQKARISLVRTLLSEPKALLLDEPFSALDKTQRALFRQWVFDHIQARELPTLLVTHDSDDVPPQGVCLPWESLGAPC